MTNPVTFGRVVLHFFVATGTAKFLPLQSLLKLDASVAVRAPVIDNGIAVRTLKPATGRIFLQLQFGPARAALNANLLFLLQPAHKALEVVGVANLAERTEMLTA